MIEKFRITFVTILLLGLFAYSISAIHFFITTDTWIHYQDCGKVVGSSSEDRPVKHGSQTEFYLLIQYEKQGFKAQEVGVTTYYQYKDAIGKKLCFEQSESNPVISTIYDHIKHFLGVFFIIVYVIVFLVIFIGWCAGDLKI